MPRLEQEAPVPSLPTAAAQTTVFWWLIEPASGSRCHCGFCPLGGGRSHSRLRGVPRLHTPLGAQLPAGRPRNADLNGLELQRQVGEQASDLPIIFITDCTDVRVAVQAMQAGAVEFLGKPPPDKALIRAMTNALERSAAALDQERQLHALRRRYELLSRRERDMMGGVVSGLLNKQVGGELGISEITVKAHRGQVMRKMKANSLADLVIMAAQLGMGIAPRTPGCFPGRHGGRWQLDRQYSPRRGACEPQSP